MTIQIGMNGRFFPANWRPAIQEIEFAHQNQFEAVQWRGPAGGLRESDLGAPLEVVAAELARTGLQPVMELMLIVDEKGEMPEGGRPLDALTANLPAIEAMGFTAVHWHLIPAGDPSDDECRALELALRPQLSEGVALGNKYGFRFGIEHNEPRMGLFGTSAACTAALEAVEGLQFVWDFNHTTPDEFAAFAALAPRMSMLHISDTAWPEVNYHLPLGLGNLDLRPFIEVLENAGFDGVGVLEIGGLPLSGGYGRDTDEALIDSRGRLLELL